jgi:hypothetical protein
VRGETQPGYRADVFGLHLGGQEDRVLATAMLQVLHTTPWLAMRDHWALTVNRSRAPAVGRMRTLLKDLREREGRPLDQD